MNLSSENRGTPVQLALTPSCAHLLDAGEGLTVGVIGKKGNPVDYSLPLEEIREQEINLVSAASGARKNSIAFMNQVHGTDIRTVALPLPESRLTVGECDGMVTDDPGACLVIRTADCVPVFIHDREARLLGAAHSGWRGTRDGVVTALARAMRRDFSARPENMTACILPSIGPGSYEVREDVARHFPDHVIERDEGLYLDLWTNIVESLLREGVPEGNILNTGICTLKENRTFFSHRGGDPGRNLNFAVMG